VLGRPLLDALVVKPRRDPGFVSVRLVLPQLKRAFGHRSTSPRHASAGRLPLASAYASELTEGVPAASNHSLKPGGRITGPRPKEALRRRQPRPKLGASSASKRRCSASSTGYLARASRPGPLSAAVKRFSKGAGAIGLDFAVPSSSVSPSDDLSTRSGAAFDTLIPWGQRRFGERFEVLAGCRAKKVIVEDGAVRGIECRVTSRTLRIDAPTVVLAAGAVKSSEILRASGIKRNVGRRLSFDVSSALTADFGDTLNAFEGVQLATAVNREGREFVAETVWGDPAAQALALPGWFSQHTANMRRYPYMMAVRVHFGVNRTGNDELLPFMRPSANVSLKPPELRALLDRLSDVGEILFAAGAKRVMPHTLRYHEYGSVEELNALTLDVPTSKEISVVARPQGGNPISRDPDRGVVGPDLAVHGHPRLLVCDASAFPGWVVRNPRLLAMALAEHAAACWSRRADL